VPTIPDVTLRRSSSARGVGLGESRVSDVGGVSINNSGALRLPNGASRRGPCELGGKGSQRRRLERLRDGDEDCLIGLEGSRLAVAESREWDIGVGRRRDPFFRRDELCVRMTYSIFHREPVSVLRGPAFLSVVVRARSRQSGGGLEGECSRDDQVSGDGKHDGEVVMRKSLMESSRR
jgi:hypothetical protein